VSSSFSLSGLDHNHHTQVVLDVAPIYRSCTCSYFACLQGEGFSEEPGGHLDALLSGSDNFHFGNPAAQLWEVISSGAAAPRVRRQQELLLQIKQQLAAAALRTYHNGQVGCYRMAASFCCRCCRGCLWACDVLQCWHEVPVLHSYCTIPHSLHAQECGHGLALAVRHPSGLVPSIVLSGWDADRLNVCVTSAPRLKGVARVSTHKNIMLCCALCTGVHIPGHAEVVGCHPTPRRPHLSPAGCMECSTGW
jgi:hypothetical protein